jgi:hypothetical protein
MRYICAHYQILLKVGELMSVLICTLSTYCPKMRRKAGDSHEFAFILLGFEVDSLYPCKLARLCIFFFFPPNSNTF